ncbi:hypothetical protein SJAG_01434 [Schizosaccharomyces japonicus yFS275]|uniref:Rhodanese domain-containing protein n=1 Tax=Schizosaccharomyces japonicus (strain yFS275 / FY16936) TaxID=402676 RepID=B6JXX2_SCHJY|nr:hypothetical protein SJAG_01434 [Schizosaccharomyces japonicus yFS275]EEB06390.1 hypothetical protein SJAG_01434 [Schizosaccharomyces japonicus yFS275]
MTTSLIETERSLVTKVAKGLLKCLDTRDAHEFTRCHIQNSVNIHYSKLQHLWFQLPAKQVPLVVVEDGIHGIDENEQGTCGSQLKDRGWLVEKSIIANESLWNWCRENGFLEEGTSKQVLFSPSPHLAAVIDKIETAFAPKKTARVLDIGCGSGRDLAWLCFRSKFQWMVSALDAEKRAINRFTDFFEQLNLESRVEDACVAKVDQNGLWTLYTREGKRVTDQEGLTTASFLSSNFRFNESEKFDLILQIRFLNRALLKDTAEMLNKNGFLFLCTFTDDGKTVYEYPKTQDHRLQKGEIKKLVAKLDGLELVCDDIGYIEDGRPVEVVLIQKTN